jgi:serine/threonine protein kinase
VSSESQSHGKGKVLLAGRYELLELAGQGGMATVWRAVQKGSAGFRRQVAVKRILPEQCGDEYVAMFIEEARVGSQLLHPNIVQILDFGVDEDGKYFMVMEWVDGIDLWRFLLAHNGAGVHARWPLVAAVGIEALRGLGAAHERRDAIVKLSDFGVSRAADRASWTSPDIVKGKLSYMAPEIFEDRGFSPRSDLFSLSVALWETLAGRKLYEGASDVEIFMAAQKAEVPSLLDLRPDVPPALAGILERALAKDPANRFASAYLMLRELADLLRLVPETTDAPAIARAVKEVSAGGTPRGPDPLEEAPVTRPFRPQPRPSSTRSFPPFQQPVHALTRRKKH